MSSDGVTIEDKLAELEDRLDAIAAALDEQDFNEARDKAVGISDILDCPLCKNIENGILGGVMFAGSLSPQGRERRARAVKNEVEWFAEEQLADAKDRIKQLEAAD
jgi:hypothetical protein